jgi:hypothetical protein
MTLGLHEVTFGVNWALTQVGEEAKSIVGAFIDCFCRPGDHIDDFVV